MLASLSGGGLPLLRAQREAAAERLPPEVLDYYDAGAGDEVTRREGALAWASYRLRPRVLRDVGTVSTETTLLGQHLAHPVGVAPMAFHALATPDGELATAAATGANGGLLGLSTRSSRSLEEVAAAAAQHGAPWWFQVYVMKDRSLTEALVRRAVDAGAGALVLTGDTPYVGRKRRVTGTRLSVPDDHFLVNLAPHFAERVDAGGAELTVAAQRAAAEQDPTIDLATIGWLAEVSGLPVLVKGVLRGDDAVACLQAGAAGVVVSNHGGRQLDRSVPSALALPEVAAAVREHARVSGPLPGGYAPVVLVDGGVRTGTDVLTALALGADGVLVGRPLLWALAAGGADAAGACIAEVVSDLKHAMALAGAASLSGITPDLVHPSGAVLSRGA
ncbi:4-hydroxymandelate oxidase [Quadrisphaera granulorum]|uniref:4-hydroxymandelate oxidase n=1 Tax=Quadrisphaera granulorum TaxID=317664 RepID=A0A316AEL4_9ACTN|nr:alpha-hydroxy acid oxidase [Quadrisphaera granulorum]PWJ56061.1 4-hydroxymandelate oxidase [Quadrisphaera granulorum]SZE94695.1 4-hydroxymandelate oxidase [Quadrisphaera granulorum]